MCFLLFVDNNDDEMIMTDRVLYCVHSLATRMCVNKQRSRSILHWIRFYIYAKRSINKYMKTCWNTTARIRQKFAIIYVLCREKFRDSDCVEWVALDCLKRRFFCQLICLPHRMSQFKSHFLSLNDKVTTRQSINLKTWVTLLLLRST